MARMTKNSMKPMIMYTKITEGPAAEMVLPEPMNRPVPIAPPMAISWMWRLLSCRSRCGAPLPGDVGEWVVIEELHRSSGTRGVAKIGFPPRSVLDLRVSTRRDGVLAPSVSQDRAWLLSRVASPRRYVGLRVSWGGFAPTAPAERTGRALPPQVKSVCLVNQCSVVRGHPSQAR